MTAFSPDCNIRIYQASSGLLIHTLKVSTGGHYCWRFSLNTNHSALSIVAQGHRGEVFVVEPHPSDSRILLSAGGCVDGCEICVKHSFMYGCTCDRHCT